MAKAYLIEAQPHLDAALMGNPRHPEYRQPYRTNLLVLIYVNAGLMDQVAAADTAARVRELGWDSQNDAFEAAKAVAKCITVTEWNYDGDREKRQSAAQFYSDHAMAVLRDAVAKGFKDAVKMKSDPHLAPLRQRDDFQELLAKLEAGQ